MSGQVIDGLPAVDYIEIPCNNGSGSRNLVSFDYQGNNPNDWLLEESHFSSFNSYSHSPCVSPTTLDFAGMDAPNGGGIGVGHSGGSIVNGEGLICTGGWDSVYTAGSDNVVSFDLTFAQDASGSLDEFSFMLNSFVGTDFDNEGFQLSVVDSSGSQLWTSGQQEMSAVGVNTTHTFDLSSIEVTGGETLTFETYLWGDTGAYIGNFGVTSNGSLCACPEPSSSLLIVLSSAFLAGRRKRS